MSLTALILSAALAAMPGPSIFVSSVKTSEFVELCDQSDGDLTANFCIGYILGSYDQLSANRLICPREGGGSKQAVAVARKYLRDHPEQWDQHPLGIVERAFRQAFPCAEVGK